MRAVITGATSGIGLEFAKILHNMHYDLTLVARRNDRLLALKEKFGENTQIICADLSVRDEVFRVFSEIQTDETEILINNAGFGLCGDFAETDMKKELSMIDVNVTAVYILTKLFYKEFLKRNSGYILNVSSIASFFPGPLLTSYYASKAYVRTLTESIRGEIAARRSNIYIGALCPGPVKTEFDRVAEVKFSLKGADAHKTALYAVKKMFRKKTIILPAFSVKAAVFFSRFVPRGILTKIMYKMQRKKQFSDKIS